MKIPFQDLRDSDKTLQPEIEAAVLGVIRSGRYLFGENVTGLERELSEIVGSPYSLGVSNGLDALRLILEGYKALGRLKTGDEVIVPANTFIATFLSVAQAGLQPVVAEPSELDFNLDFRKIKLGSRTKAIIPVHLFGTTCWDREVFEEARHKGVLIIEDNAQALGAEASDAGFHGDRRAGHLGDASAISFYPAKNIGAYGDAGAVLTSDEELATAIRKLANYGSQTKYHHELLGFNCRMDEIQAALLRVKLAHLEDVTNRRTLIAETYERHIRNSKIEKPIIFPDRRQVWHQYVIRSSERDRLRKYLMEKGIQTEIHYPVPSHLQPCLREVLPGIEAGQFPIAEKLAREILSLPIANVNEEEAKYIASTLNDF